MRKSATKLTSLRNRIEAVDAEILSAIAKRAKLAALVGEIKIERGLNPLDSVRKAVQKKRWAALARKMKLPAKLASRIYTLLHDHAISVERSMKL